MLAFVDQRLFRHAHPRTVAAGIDRHIGEHLRLEHAILVVDRGAHQQPAGRRIDRGGDVVDPRLELPARHGEQRERQFLADRHAGRFGFPHEGRQPHRREIADHEYRIAGAAVDELTGPDLALHDGAGNRRIDRGIGADLPGLLECRDLLFRAAENSQPVACGLERRLRRTHVVLGLDQIGLRLLPVLERHRLARIEIVGRFSTICARLSLERALFSALSAATKSFNPCTVSVASTMNSACPRSTVSLGFTRSLVTRPA